jgi:hypothetical protein
MGEAARQVLAGTEARADVGDLTALRGLLRRTGAESGFGRLAWDLGDATDPRPAAFGDNEVFWQAPIWTDG